MYRFVTCHTAPFHSTVVDSILINTSCQAVMSLRDPDSLTLFTMK